MAGIEYLDEPADAVGGVDTSAGPPPRHRRRAARPASLLVLVGLAFAAVLVARAVSSSGRHAPPKPVPGYPLAACSVREDSVRPEISTGLPARSTLSFDPADVRPARQVACSGTSAACPQATDGQNACQTTDELPDAVVTAVRARFPGARVLDTYTETVRENGRLWYRYVHFRLPRATDLSVEVVNGHPDEAPTGEWDSGSGLFSRVADKRGQVTTAVTVDGPSGSASTLAEQAALARNPALATR